MLILSPFRRLIELHLHHRHLTSVDVLPLELGVRSGKRLFGDDVANVILEHDFEWADAFATAMLPGVVDDNACDTRRSGQLNCPPSLELGV